MFNITTKYDVMCDLHILVFQVTRLFVIFRILKFLSRLSLVELQLTPAPSVQYREKQEPMEPQFMAPPAPRGFVRGREEKENRVN